MRKKPIARLLIASESVYDKLLLYLLYRASHLH